jgi:hypothetical protein
MSKPSHSFYASGIWAWLLFLLVLLAWADIVYRLVTALT